ncbi:SRPBCC family protein [Geodermatophilus sp. YIM 151500]|uniref:SRPBCC family protein n=1 Tax=Geodermatophilus sp. YIM 151500 TaxID=2984531 RepID=UPI0021E3BE4E|nr:SRPBCC family protein [Geodermatophilus sp. YIM 151500]MCV2488514.1 SRPBCC family protein [Geodermatophilus sp. YIM 151500]
MAHDTYTVERSATVAAPPERVYERIVDLHRWTAWSPWEEVDPAMHREYSGAESGVGAVYAWSGNRKAGAGRMTVVEATESSRVCIDLAFDEPFKARNDTRFSIEPDGAGSRVTWTMTGRETVGVRVMSLVKPMDAMVGPDFERGLTRLRGVVGRRPSAERSRVPAVRSPSGPADRRQPFCSASASITRMPLGPRT